MSERTDNSRVSIRSHIREGALVHAYGIEGVRDAALSELLDVCEDVLNCTTRGNPDFQILHFDAFTVNEARALRARALERPFAGVRKFFVIAFLSITHEAQNALLKLFEEPTRSTHFFLVMPSHELLLPTVRSRLYLITLHAPLGGVETRTRDFLNASPSERLLLLKSIIDSKDKAEAIQFLNDLEIYLHKNGGVESSFEMREVLRDIIRARGYLRGRSPSVKMLLEGIALLLPSAR